MLPFDVDDFKLHHSFSSNSPQIYFILVCSHYKFHKSLQKNMKTIIINPFPCLPISTELCGATFVLVWQKTARCKMLALRGLR